MESPKPSNNLIAVICIVLGVGLVAYVFMASRLDPGLRMAALVAATGVVSALVAIASTILTGKDVSKPDAKDIPPGSKVTDQTVVDRTASTSQDH